MVFYEFFFSLYKLLSNHKEKLQKEARKRYQNLSEEEKEKRVSIIVHVIGIFLRNKKRSKSNCLVA